MVSLIAFEAMAFYSFLGVNQCHVEDELKVKERLTLEIEYPRDMEQTSKINKGPLLKPEFKYDKPFYSSS